MDDETAKKDKKSRSTSRGILGRLQNKKDEVEAKREEKKEEKKEEKEEKKIEKEEAKEEKKIEKEEKKEEKHGEALPAAAAVGGGAAALDAEGTGESLITVNHTFVLTDNSLADRAIGAPIEDKHEPAVEATPAARPQAEQTKSKRGSIFGRVQSGWNSVKSPSKEKSEKEAELKPEVPPKDTVVSETAPQIPEPTTATEPTIEEPATTAAPTVETTAAPKTESKPAEAAKEKLDAVSPKERSGGFLSNFLNKRNRSVSPSANLKEAPKKEEAPVAPAKDEVAPTETAPAAAAIDEPATTTTETPAAPVAEPAEKPAEKIEEPVKKTEEPATSPSTNKRQSVIGNLGRRASKAFKGFNTPSNKKENVTPRHHRDEEGRGGRD